MAIVVPIISSFDSKGIQKAMRDFKQLKTAGDKMAYGLLNANKSVNSFGASLGKLTAIGGGIAGVIGGKLVSAAYESQKVLKQTDAIITATGSAAGMTAKQIANLANELSLKTGIDDESIQSNLNVLLTFKAVRNEVGKGNDVFNRAAAAALDLGNVFGSADAAAIQLGKALSNPIKGVTALRKSGVDFTEQQITQIKTLVQSGKVLEAQKIILGEVEAQVGGTAEAGATGFDKMRVAIDNAQENLGMVLLPYVEKFATFVTNSVVPAIDRFSEIVGTQGLASGINYLNGAIINSIWNMGKLGKTILAVTTAVAALKVATITYRTSMLAMTAVTTLTDGALKALIVRLGQTKIAMMAAGGVTALIAIAGIAYAKYATDKQKAEQQTRAFTEALMLEGVAQSDAFKELTKTNSQFKIMVASLGDVGLSMNDVNQYVSNGTGKFAAYVAGLDAVTASGKTGTAALDVYAKTVGIAVGAQSSVGGELAFGISQFATLVKGLRGDQVATNAAVGLLGKIGVNSFATVGKEVESATEKMKKAKDAVKSVVDIQSQMTSATKATAQAQTSLQTATDKVASAQAKLSQIAKGYGAGSKQAVDAQKQLAQAQRDSTRAGFALADAQNAVLAAQRKIADLTKAADPRTIQEAQDDLTQAQFRQTDAQTALNEARIGGNQREITEAEIALREATNQVTDANTKLTESQAAADPALLAEAQRDLTIAELGVTEAEIAQKASTDAVDEAQRLLNETINGASTSSDIYKEAVLQLNEAQAEQAEAIDRVRDAKTRELSVTRNLAKAEILLRKARGKLSKKQKASLDNLLADLNTPVVVNVPNPSVGAVPLATGGIVRQPTLALVGEAGAEAVIPLSKMNQGNSNVYNISVNSKIADDTLPDLIVAELRKFNRRSGAINIQVA
jgi:hypothetical protein